MTYTLIKSKEQERLIEICNAFTCFGKHLRITQPDAQGKVFPYLNDKCRTCSSADKCRALRQLADAWLNNEVFKVGS